MAEAIGFAVHLLSQEQLNAQLPALVHCVLGLYKKHNDHYYISQVRLHMHTIYELLLVLDNSMIALSEYLAIMIMMVKIYYRDYTSQKFTIMIVAFG